jgi:hypothetical protein
LVSHLLSIEEVQPSKQLTHPIFYADFFTLAEDVAEVSRNGKENVKIYE